MAGKSISEVERVRYLLGLCSPVEREQIESDYWEDEGAFQEMLSAEDDLFDAYARGELAVEERRRFENRFASSLRGRDRVQFARALAGAKYGLRSVKTQLPGPWPDIFKTIQSPRLLRMATITSVIVVVAVFAWLVIDRRRMTNDLRDLSAQSAELSKRTETLQRDSDAERTRTAEMAAQLADLQTQPAKSGHPERAITATQQVRHLLEINNNRKRIAKLRSERIETAINQSDAKLGNNFEWKVITQLPLDVRNVANLLSLQPGSTSSGYAAGARADQSNITLDGVDVNGSLNSASLIPRNASSSDSSTVRGTAKDQNGNLVSGATVTLIDVGRNFTRTQSTNEDGVYVFNAIPPGTYSIEVQAPGFKAASISGLAKLVNTPSICDVQLEIGAVSETVQVNSSAEGAINTTDATLGNSFERQRITQLPLSANNVVGMLLGVNRTGFVKGGHTDQSYITLDGVETIVCIPSFVSWIRFQMALEAAAIHDEYRVTIKTADGRTVTSDNWIEPLTPNQITIDTPAISTSELPSGEYVLLLMGKEPDGSFVKVVGYPFKVIKH